MEQVNNYFHPLLRIEIIEQPAQNHARFRYECERRNSKIPGENSTKSKPTYPTIKVSGPYNEGEIIVIYVSCVTSDRPHKPHPYNLVGTECRNGICRKFLDKKTMTVTFTDLQINCVKKDGFDASLDLRKKQRLFSSRNDDFTPVYDSNQNFDLNCLRLCFQGFLYRNGDYTRPIPLEPIVSNPIFSGRTKDDKGFNIVHLSHTNAPAAENTEITLLCTKVNKNDCEVIFLDKGNGWSEKGKIKRFHQQTAIVVEKPLYPITINEAIKVHILLHEPSTKRNSDRVKFWFLPNESDSPRRKIPKKINHSPSQHQCSSLENYRAIEQLGQELAAMDTEAIPSCSNNQDTIDFLFRGSNRSANLTKNQSQPSMFNQNLPSQHQCSSWENNRPIEQLKQELAATYTEAIPSCSNNQDTVELTISNQSQPSNMLNWNVDDPAEIVPNLTNEISPFTPCFDYCEDTNVDPLETINQFEVFPSSSNNQDTTSDFSNSFSYLSMNDPNQPFMLERNVGNPAESDIQDEEFATDELFEGASS